MSPAPQGVDLPRMDEVIDALGELIRELQEEDMGEDGHWKCDGCGMTHIGNAVKPLRIEVGEALIRFCAACSPGVVSVKDILEQVPEAKILEAEE